MMERTRRQERRCASHHIGDTTDMMLHSRLGFRRSVGNTTLCRAARTMPGQGGTAEFAIGNALHAVIRTMIQTSKLFYSRAARARARFGAVPFYPCWQPSSLFPDGVGVSVVLLRGEMDGRGIPCCSFVVVAVLTTFNSCSTTAKLVDASYCKGAWELGSDVRVIGSGMTMERGQESCRHLVTSEFGQILFMVQKSQSVFAGGKPNKGEFCHCYHTH